MKTQLIKENVVPLWRKHTTDVELTIANKPESVNVASFNPRRNRISINAEYLVRNHKKFLSDKVSLSNYIQLITLHEIGHSKDPLLRETHRLVIEHWEEHEDKSKPMKERKNSLLLHQKYVWLMECRAWRWARKNLPVNITKEEFYATMRFGMECYRRDFVKK